MITNILLVLFGCAAVVIGTCRLLFNLSTQRHQVKILKHGEQRIIKLGDRYWTEQYFAFPGWNLNKPFNTLEQARAAKASWEKIQARTEDDPVVIE